MDIRPYRAVVADELGPIENYSIRPVDPKPLGPDEVRILVKAAGVSFVDVLVAAGKYQALPKTPFTPGSECAGIVCEVGGRVKSFAPGDNVIVTGWAGAFAEVVTAPQSAVWSMPSALFYEEAATLLVSYATVLHALVDRADIQPGESLLVLGAGGATGYAAVQLGARFGARVIASASTGAKRELARSAGAQALVDSRSNAWRADVLEANGGRPLDVVFDPVGGAATEAAFRALGWKGRHLVVGFPAGIARLPTNLPLLKGAGLIGVSLAQLSVHEPDRARMIQDRVLELAAQGAIRPVIARSYSLERFAAAMSDASRGDSAGRIVLSPGRP